VLAALAGNAFFWLDLDDEATDGMVSELLTTHFGFHHLAVQSAERFKQRPRIDAYDGFVYLVGRRGRPGSHGQGGGPLLLDRPLRRDRAPGEMPHGGSRAGIPREPSAERRGFAAIGVVYLVVGGLVDSFFPVLSKFDDRIDSLEDDTPQGTDRASKLGGAVPDEAVAHGHAQDRGAPARHDRQYQHRRH